MNSVNTRNYVDLWTSCPFPRQAHLSLCFALLVLIPTEDMPRLRRREKEGKSIDIYSTFCRLRLVCISYFMGCEGRAAFKTALLSYTTAHIYYQLGFCSLPSLQTIASCTKYAFTDAPIDYQSFADPPALFRPRFRYWLPDASVDPAIAAADIDAAGAVGAGGVEFLP